MPVSNPSSDDRASLVKYAALILNLRPYFRHKLKEKLVLRSKKLAFKDTGPVIESILDDLQKSGYLNDPYLAEAFIRRQLAKGYGTRIIRLKLNALRLSKEVIDIALETVADNKAQLSSAMHLLTKKRITDHRKAMSVLYQRGFESKVISKLFDGELYED